MIRHIYVLNRNVGEADKQRMLRCMREEVALRDVPMWHALITATSPMALDLVQVIRREKLTEADVLCDPTGCLSPLVVEVYRKESGLPRLYSQADLGMEEVSGPAVHLQRPPSAHPPMGGRRWHPRKK